MSPEIPIMPSGSQDPGTTSPKRGAIGHPGTDRANQNSSRETTSETPNQSREGNGSAGSESGGSPGEEELRETTEFLNKSAQVLNRDLRFNVLPEEDLVQAEIVNNETDEVIQKIPSPTN